VKFETIFSPIERELKRKFVSRRSSIKWRKNHPEWFEKRKPLNVLSAKRWKLNHPGADQREGKKRVQMMRRHYLVQLLRQHGRPVTPETIEQKRAELQAYRSRKLFEMIYATSEITKRTGRD